jgi:hypothetical protein
MISDSLLADVEHTETHADMSFGALITTADFGADFFDADMIGTFRLGLVAVCRGRTQLLHRNRFRTTTKASGAVSVARAWRAYSVNRMERVSVARG